MSPYLKTHAAGNETVMIGLTAAVRGDIAVRADKSACYILGNSATGGYATAANWLRMLGLSNLVAAEATLAAAAVLAASVDFDTAYRWQGCKYDATQDNEFPRLAYGATTVQGNLSLSYPGTVSVYTSPADIWDWDDTTEDAVAPMDVLVAVATQADSLLAGDRTERVRAIADGLSSQNTASLAESYRADATAKVLCARADQLAQRFRLRTGQML